MYTAELYPTEIRGTALGLCSVLGRVGSILAPQVKAVRSQLKYIFQIAFSLKDSFTITTSPFSQIALYLGPALDAPRLPLFLLGCCALFGGLLSLLLPETLGIPLMASLDELDGISARTKPFFAWWTRARLRESLERNAKIREQGRDTTKGLSYQATNIELPSK